MSESKSLATALASLSETKDRSSKNSKFDDPKLDPVWLYEELRKEISKEATYNLENDAKFRAVSQGTVNYEQFRYVKYKNYTELTLTHLERFHTLTCTLSGNDAVYEVSF